MNLASWVLVGGAAGIITGIVFGDDCAILSPIGFAYVAAAARRLPLPHLLAPPRPGIAGASQGLAALQVRLDVLRGRVNYWLLGQPRTLATPRWSVVRDVLHWNF